MSPAAVPFLVSFAISTAISVAFTALAAGVQLLLSGQKKESLRQQGRDTRQRQNITSTVANIPVVYGTARVGGLRVFAETKFAFNGTETIWQQGTKVMLDTKSYYLYVVTAFAEGEIDNYESILIDGIDSNDPKFESPYKVDLTFAWSYTEPDEVVTYTWIQTNILKPGTSDYLTVRQVANPKRYRLTRTNTTTGKTETVWESPRGITQAQTLINTQYGDFDFQLDYIKDTGEVVAVGNATVHIDQDNDDFTQSVDNNLTFSQDSKQNGEFIFSETRKGGSDNDSIPTFLTSADIGYSVDRKGTKVAYVAHRFLKHTGGQKTPERNPIKQIPQITAIVKGKLVYDWRDVTQSETDETTWKWSDNPAVCLRDYLTNTIYGAKIDSTLIDATSFDEAADYCDELVLRPSGESTTRYTCNGVVNTEQTQVENIKELLTCCNGRLIYRSGEYRLKIMKPESPSFTFDSSNVLEGEVSVSNSGIRYKHNGIKAEYIDPNISYQSNFVQINSASYKSQDKDRELIQELQYPFTTDYEQVSALSIIALNESRLGKRVSLSADFSTFNNVVGDLVNFTWEPFNWVNKKFRVSTMTAVTSPDRVGDIDYTLDEYSDDTYNIFNYELAPTNTESAIDSPFNVSAPSGLSFSQTFEQNAQGDFINVVNVNWYPSQSPDIAVYQVDYKPYANGQWILAGTSTSQNIKIFQLSAGEYLFRVKAINSIGYESLYVQKQLEIVNNRDIPPDVTNFLLKNGNGMVTLTWDYMPEVAISGGFVVKAIDNTVDPLWTDIAVFQKYVPGKTTELMIPQIDGTYLIKAKNTAGVESAIATEVVLDLPDDSEFTLVDTIISDPTFSGTKEFIEVGAGKLTLSALASFDDIPNVDLVPNIDTYGGKSNVGTYEDDGYSDLGAVFKRVKLKRILQSSVTAFDNNFDLIENVDTVANVDAIGGSAVSQGNLMYAVTSDDPAGTPTWSDWKQLTEEVISGRAFKIRLELFSDSMQQNIQIEQMRCQVLLPKLVDSDQVAITSASQRVSFDLKFYQAPKLTVSINNAASGDYYEITSLNTTGFNITVKDSGGSTATTRTINYVAQGIGEELI